MSILTQAEALVTGDRHQSYGHPAEDLARVGRMWSAYLGFPVSANDVAMMMILLKVSRQHHSFKQDNLIDIAGYALCADLMEPRSTTEADKAVRDSLIGVIAAFDGREAQP